MIKHREVAPYHLMQFVLQQCKAATYSLASLFLLDGGLDSSSSVSEVLGINALKGSIALSLGLGDSISVSFSVLVVVGVVLALCHFS